MLEKTLTTEVLRDLGFSPETTARLSNGCYVNMEVGNDIDCSVFVGFFWGKHGWEATSPAWGKEGISEPLLTEEEIVSGKVDWYSDFFIKGLDRKGVVSALNRLANVVGKENVFLNAQVVLDDYGDVSVMYVHILNDKTLCWR